MHKQQITEAEWRRLGGLRNGDLFTSTDKAGKRTFWRVLDNR